MVTIQLQLNDRDAESLQKHWQAFRVIQAPALHHKWWLAEFVMINCEQLVRVIMEQVVEQVCIEGQESHAKRQGS